MFEINLQNEVVRLRSIERPEPTPNLSKVKADTAPSSPHVGAASLVASIDESAVAELANSTVIESHLPEKGEEAWPDYFTEKLSPLLPLATITSLKEMFLQGPTPPAISSSGLSGEMTAASNPEIENAAEASQHPFPPTTTTATPIQLPLDAKSPKPPKATRGGRSGRGKHNDRGRGRGGRGESRQKRSDTRTVLSEVSAVHNACRQYDIA